MDIVNPEFIPAGVGSKPWSEMDNILKVMTTAPPKPLTLEQQLRKERKAGLDRKKKRKK